MQWVTRERPKVDRIACPWLIRRFVDPDAEFIFLPAEDVTAFAERTGAIPYDVPGVELGHHGAECSFDAILRAYKLTDPALLRLALIVRGADTPAKDLTPESPGLEAIADGFRRLYTNDLEQLAAEEIVYDALYSWCAAQESAGITRTVAFVCLHGAAKSRIAAAFFNQIAPPGWTAISAGIEPDLELSPTAARLLAGTDAAARLDTDPPRTIESVGQVSRTIGIDTEPGGATDHWVLSYREFDAAMRDEIRSLTDALAAELSAG